MVHFRKATIKDIEIITTLHINSWRIFYRGIWEDSYLDGPIFKERNAIWKKRFESPKENQLVLIAEKDQSPLGFICGYTNDHPKYGSLIDNLHIRQEHRGLGIGKILISEFAKEVVTQFPSAGIYLWCIEKNQQARIFYDKLTGKIVETVPIKNPDGTFSPCCRYFWDNPNKLIQYL